MFEQTAGPDSENADPLSPSPKQALVWTNPVTRPKVQGSSSHTDRADSHCWGLDPKGDLIPSFSGSFATN